MFLLSFALSCFLGMSFLFPSIEGVLFPFFDRPSVTTLKPIPQRSQTPPLTERNPNLPPMTSSSTQSNSPEESPIFLPSSSISSTEETALEEISKNPSTLSKEPDISSTGQSFTSTTDSSTTDSFITDTSTTGSSTTDSSTTDSSTTDSSTTDSVTTEIAREKSLSSEGNASGKESGSTTDSPSTSIFIEPTSSSVEKESVGDSDEEEKITETSTEIVAKNESTTAVETETSTPESSNSKLMKEAALVLKTNVTQAENFSNVSESVSRQNNYTSETTIASQDVPAVTKPPTQEGKEKRQSFPPETNLSSSEESVSTVEDNDDDDDNKEDSSSDLEEESNTLVTPVTSSLIANEEHLANKSEGNFTEEVTHPSKETSRTSVATEDKKVKEEKVYSDGKSDIVKNNVTDADEVVPSNQWSSNNTNNITKESITETTTASNPSNNREGTSPRPDKHPDSSTKFPSFSTEKPSTTTLVVDVTTSLLPAVDTTTEIHEKTQEIKCPAWHSFIPHKKTCEVTPLDSFRRFWSTITPRYGPHRFWSMFFGRSYR